MGAERFDRIARAFQYGLPRRRVIAALLAGGLVGHGWADAPDASARTCKKIRNKKKRKKCLARQCLPSCAGKVCGDDGCGASCGTCATPRTACRNGQCTCPADECKGMCKDACEATRLRNPVTCDCCIANFKPCVPASNECCGGACLDLGLGFICIGLANGATCDFDAQCQSGNCLPGFDGAPSTCTPILNP